MTDRPRKEPNAANSGTASANALGSCDRMVGPGELGFDARGLQRLHDYMQGMVDGGQIVGVNYMILRHGQVAARDQIGLADAAHGLPMQPDTIFRIYSMTKPIVAVALMQLYEQGLWQLDDPVTRFIPEFARLRVFKGVDAAGGLIVRAPARMPTIRELMSHTAGFGYGLFDAHPVDRLVSERAVLQSQSLHGMIEAIADIPLLFEPGEEWSYSLASDIQGYLVERLSGQSLGTYLDEAILAPLGMVDTGFQTHGKGAAARLARIYEAGPDGRLIEAVSVFGTPIHDVTRPPPLEMGGGGLVSTAADYARFCQMILNRGELDEVRILAPETVELMGTNMIRPDVLAQPNPARLLPFNPGFGYGLGFSVMMDPAMNATVEGAGTLAWGGAGGTWFWIDPVNDLIFIGLIQRLADPVSAEFRNTARILTYEALTRPDL